MEVEPLRCVGCFGVQLEVLKVTLKFNWCTVCSSALVSESSRKHLVVFQEDFCGCSLQGWVALSAVREGAGFLLLRALDSSSWLEWWDLALAEGPGRDSDTCQGTWHWGDLPGAELQLQPHPSARGNLGAHFICHLPVSLFTLKEAVDGLGGMVLFLDKYCNSAFIVSESIFLKLIVLN